MIDGVDQDRRVDIPKEQNVILARFLPEHKLNTNEKKILSEIIWDKEPIRKNKIFSQIEFSKNNLKEIIPLNLINPLILERGNADRRLDDFIRQGMREIPQGVDHRFPADDLHVPGLDPKKWFSSPTGLRASVAVGYTGTLTVNGERVRFENHNDIHFTPEGRNRFDPSTMTESLISGIQGVAELIDAIDQGRFEAASIFVGTTNINMALIAQRLGFVIVDECRTRDGNINKNLRFFIVVGKLEDIRDRVKEFEKAGVAQKLEQRNQRLQAKPKLAPVGA